MSTAPTSHSAATIALVVHGQRPEATALARDVADWLIAQGHQVRVPTPDARQAGLEEWACDPDKLSLGAQEAATQLAAAEVDADGVAIRGHRWSRRGGWRRGSGDVRLSCRRPSSAPTTRRP